MRKVIASINMTFDGYCDHTSAIANAEVHDYYTNLLKNAGTLLYGRTTYQLMEEAWPNLVKNPSGEKHMDDFAAAIDSVPKVLFSRTLKSVAWESTRLATMELKDEVAELKQQPGRDIYVGSPGLINQLTQLNLVDLWQICVHPIIVGKGLRLFKDLNDQVVLKLVKMETFRTSGHVVFFYERGE